MKKTETIITCLLFAFSVLNIQAQKKVLYVNQTGVDPGNQGSEPSNDPIISMLNDDGNFEVTYIETPQDGSKIPSLSSFDLIIAQESIVSGADLFKPDGKLGIKNLSVPIIYCKTSAFRNGKAITDADASASNTQNLYLTVPKANQGHDLFSGIDFGDQEKIQITYNLTNGSGSDPGDKAIEIVNELEISTPGTLLGTVPEVTNPDKAIVVNFLPSGTQLGESSTDVLQVDAITLSFCYGPLVYQNGVNISNEALTIWRNAAYILTGMDVPTEMYYNSALTKKVLYINQSGLSMETDNRAEPRYDPIIRMLTFEEFFDVTYIETPKDGSKIPGLSNYDLIIIQESLNADGSVFASEGKLGKTDHSVPIIYNNTGAFSNGSGVTDSDAAIVKTKNLSVSVEPSNQSHDLFRGINFSGGNFVKLFSSTAKDESGTGEETMDIVNNLNISATGSLLASVPEITNAEQSIVINYLPAGTKLGESDTDVLNANAIALSFDYGAIVKNKGANITNEGLTIWRNAAYMLCGLPVPKDLCSSPALAKQVLYLNQKGVDPGNGEGSEPGNDPITRMLKADPNFRVTYVETYSAGNQIPDPKLFDLVIAQETMSSGAAFFKPGGKLSLRSIGTPIIYNKTAAFRNERAVNDANATLVETKNLWLEVPIEKQSHDIFSGIDFSGGNSIQIFNQTATNDGATGGDKAMDIINNLNISETGTLLATISTVTNPDEALVVNFLPAGTQLGESTADVLNVNAFAFAFCYGALVAGDGKNFSPEGITIWRNAAYILTGLEVPDNLYSTDDFAYGINKNELSELPVLCSPNPTNGLVNLTFEKGVQNVSVSIYSLNGQKLYDHQFMSNETSSTIDLSSFKGGIYILKIQSGMWSFTAKIVKL